MKEVGNTSYCPVWENLGRCTYCLLIILCWFQFAVVEVCTLLIAILVFLLQEQNPWRQAGGLYFYRAQPLWYRWLLYFNAIRKALCPLQNPTPAVSVCSCLLLLQPCTRTDFTKCCLRHSAPAVWNSLPRQQLTPWTALASHSLTVFKSRSTISTVMIWPVLWYCLWSVTLRWDRNMHIAFLWAQTVVTVGHQAS